MAYVISLTRTPIETVDGDDITIADGDSLADNRRGDLVDRRDRRPAITSESPLAVMHHLVGENDRDTSPMHNRRSRQ